LLAIALDFDRDGLRRLAGGEGQRPGLGVVVAVAGRGGAVHGAVDHRRRVLGGGGEGDREGEQGRVLPALPLGHVVDADERVVVENRALALVVGNRRVDRNAEVDGERLVRLGEPVAVHWDRDELRRFAWGEGQRPALGFVVAAGDAGSVGGAVVD